MRNPDKSPHHMDVYTLYVHTLYVYILYTCVYIIYRFTYVIIVGISLHTNISCLHRYVPTIIMLAPTHV